MRNKKLGKKRKEGKGKEEEWKQQQKGEITKGKEKGSELEKGKKKIFVLVDKIGG